MSKLIDSTNENELIKAGSHFHCSGHLQAVPISQKSPDPRYCQGCFDFLTSEWQSLKENGIHLKRADWVPVGTKKHVEATDTCCSACNNKTDIALTTGEIVTANLADKVKTLISKGLSYRVIARELGISHMTVSRLSKAVV